MSLRVYRRARRRYRYQPHLRGRSLQRRLHDLPPYRGVSGLLRCGSAKDLHATYFDHIEDADGNRLIGHFVWVQAYNDEPKTDLDGSLVRWNGFPVTLWQWVGKHSLA